MSARLFENITFNNFVKNWTSIRVSSQTDWGKVTVMTVGSFQVFIKNSDFDLCFAIQSPCFPEDLDSHSLCLNNWFLFGGQICEALICLYPSSFFKPKISHTCSWISSIFIDFSYIFIDFHRFSWIFIDFHRFSQIYIDFHGFTLIYMDFYGFETFWEQNLGPPVAACGILWHPVPPCASLCRRIGSPIY